MPSMLKLMIKVSFLASFLLLSGCSHERLSVRNEYLLPERLASYHVQTPDPLRFCPPIGQRITVEWSLREEFSQYRELIFVMLLRYRNLEEKEFIFRIKTPVGRYEYDMINNEYFSSGGVFTYKVELKGDGELLDEWRHQLWTKLITFSKENKDEAK